MRPRMIDIDRRHTSPPDPQGEECSIIGEVSAEAGTRTATREEIALLVDGQRKLEGDIRRLVREKEKAADKKRKRESSRKGDRDAPKSKSRRAN